MTFWSGSKRILMIFILTYKSDNSKTFSSLTQKGALKYFALYLLFWQIKSPHSIYFYLAQEHFSTYGGKGRLAAKGVLLNFALK